MGRRRCLPRTALKQRREKMGYTQGTMAVRARVDKQTIHRLEAGIGYPQLGEREQLAAAYGFTLPEFNQILSDSKEVKPASLEPADEPTSNPGLCPESERSAAAANPLSQVLFPVPVNASDLKNGAISSNLIHTIGEAKKPLPFNQIASVPGDVV